VLDADFQVLQYASTRVMDLFGGLVVLELGRYIGITIGSEFGLKNGAIKLLSLICPFEYHAGSFVVSLAVRRK
jgi:hypothetical protein